MLPSHAAPLHATILVAPYALMILARLTMGNGSFRFKQIGDEVIISVPDGPRLRHTPIEYAQERAGALWDAHVPNLAVPQKEGFAARCRRRIQVWSPSRSFLSP